MLAGGSGVSRVAVALDIAPATVRLWRNRFLERGSSGLLAEAPGRGRKPSLDAATRVALQRRAETDGVGVRQQARELRVSASTVSRWRRKKID